MRLIAARILECVPSKEPSSSRSPRTPRGAHSHEGAAAAVYVEGELANQPLEWSPPHRSANGYHVYCSPNNAGGVEMLQEFAVAIGAELIEMDVAKVRRSMRGRSTQRKFLHVTTDFGQVAQCDCMLVYLDSRTWTRGDALFADEVQSAQ